MPDRFFLDTNILVYTFDAQAAQKRKKAQDLVQRALDGPQGIVSYHVVQEFLNLATRKFKVPLSAKDCRAYLDQVLLPLWEVNPSPELYRKALAVAEETGWSFYDSLIVSGAIVAGCTRVYSEDMQDGRKVEQLVIENPFR